MPPYNSSTSLAEPVVAQNAAVVTIRTESDASRYVSPNVAHELNNVLTVIQGFAERLILKHGSDAALQPYLKMISDASRRAAVIVRESTPRNAPKRA